MRIWLQPSVGFRVDVLVDFNASSSVSLNVLGVVGEARLSVMEPANRASAQTADSLMLNSSALILR